jgi:hypothetical protein
MSTRNKKKQPWENQYLETCEKKWLEEEVPKLPQVDMSQGINQNTLDNICDKVLLAMKFKSEKWEMFLKDPAKRECLKYKRLEQYVYQHLDRETPSGNQAQQSTQPTIE